MRKNLINDRYEIRGLVGSGGMADVFLAHDEVLDRDVALKLLKDEYAQNKEFVERFKREARSAGSLSHPHIVPIFDWSQTQDGAYYLTMEYLPGGTLRDRIMSKGTLPARAAAAVALQIAEALQAAHKKSIIHRDIKPRNILITDSGHVKVADFGIARAAEATTISDLGDILGSAKYMSPEQAAGEAVGAASDLYSLGVVLYEMLTGKVPFEVEAPADVPAKHAGGPPPRPRELNPEVPKGTDALVMRLLATDPAERYGSAEQLTKDLRRVRDGLSPLVPLGDEATTAALGTPPASGGMRLARRRKWFPIVTVFTLLALLSAAGGAFGWNLLRDSGAVSVPEILRGAPRELSVGAGKKPSGPEEDKVPGVEGSTGQVARERLVEAGFETEARPQTSPAEDAGRVHPEVAEVPDLVGLSYPEAEKRLEEAGFLLGGVKEAPSETVPAGVITKQKPPPGTTADAGTYVYLTTSIGPSESSGGTAAGGGGSQDTSSAGSRYEPPSEASSPETEVAAALRSHYQAIGAANFEEAYSYFGPTFRSQHDQASWISGEQSYQIQSSTIHSLTVDEVSGTTATATVDVSFVDNTGTPRFVIVWGLVKEGAQWKLNQQYSAQREMASRSDSSPTPTVTSSASPSASPTPSGARVLPAREDNELPSHLVKGIQVVIYHGVDSLLRRDHPDDDTTPAADVQVSG